MPINPWPTKKLSVAGLHLDPKNPRLGRETTARAPREIVGYLFENDKAIDVAQSIATRGYFPNEPLLAVKEKDLLVVVEGNRRLAALKALREPGLLDEPFQRQVERLARQIENMDDIATVPVTVAPNRRSTDRQIVARHVGSPVLPWQGENRASFILDKLNEGYTNDQLRDQLGFTLADIQAARQTRAIADMARSLDLPDEVKARLDNPRAKLFTTVERVFESSVGRDYLKVAPDPDHGLRITTTKAEFRSAFKRLVSDVALNKQSSRTLNTGDNIRTYFESWTDTDRPKQGRGSFVPADVIEGRSVASLAHPLDSNRKPKKQSSSSQTVLPKNLQVRFGSERLRDMRRELVRLKRDDYPNAGAVLLRVFFELAVVDFLKRTGEMPTIIARLEEKKQVIPHDAPTLKQLVPEITRIVKASLPRDAAILVEKAIKYDEAAPFTISELHGFIHRADLPSPRDILQFWIRTEPLFRLMLEKDQGEPSR